MRLVESLLCDMCGRVFRHGDEPKCGVLVNGKQWCNQEVLSKELNERLKSPQPKPKDNK